MAESTFSWRPIYQELVRKLVGYEHRQEELVDILEAVLQEGLPGIQPAQIVPMGPDDTLDPFTFMGNFNRGVTHENRIAILAVVKKALGLTSPLPVDFDGIPILNNQKSWFIPHQEFRKASDIPALWTLFRLAVEKADWAAMAPAFDRALEVKQVAITKLTMGLYWIDPERFLAMDAYNERMLATYSVVMRADDAASYGAFMEALPKLVGMPPYRLSYEAWLRFRQDHWLEWALGHYVLRQPRDCEFDVWKKCIRPFTSEFLKKVFDAVQPYAGPDVAFKLYTRAAATSMPDYMDRGYCQLSVCPEGAGHGGELAVFFDLEGDSCLRWGIYHWGTPENTDVFLEWLAPLRSRLQGEFGQDTSKRPYQSWYWLGTMTADEVEHCDFDLAARVAKDLTGLLAEVREDLRVEKEDEMQEEIAPYQADAAAARFWWLNVNPKLWDFFAMRIGATFVYTTHNDKGNKRQVYQCFQQAQPGELVVAYVTAPQQEIAGLLQVTKGIHIDENGDEGVEMKKVSQLAESIPIATLKAIPALADAKTIKSHQGSLFELEAAEFGAIQELIDEEIVTVDKAAPYTREDALSDLFMDADVFDDIMSRLHRKKNVILQGPPGVGKTFVARRLAYTLLGEADKSRVPMVQFHQSYSYEDFVQGFRPSDDGQFQRSDGVFHKISRRAQGDPDRLYVLVIDEINRGNLSKIFGELLMLIEADKRGPGYAMPLTYARGTEETFYVPENLYIIGTMNTADRSLAMVDYALRRRFSFISLLPNLNRPSFASHLAACGVDADVIAMIVSRIGKLNDEIANDSNLGQGYCIGHSYFTPTDTSGVWDAAWYKDVVKYEIVPLLEEYWFDAKDKVSQWQDSLLS